MHCKESLDAAVHASRRPGWRYDADNDLTSALAQLPETIHAIRYVIGAAFCRVPTCILAEGYGASVSPSSKRMGCRSNADWTPIARYSPRKHLTHLAESRLYIQPYLHCMGAVIRLLPTHLLCQQDPFYVFQQSASIPESDSFYNSVEQRRHGEDH
ncbi:hypothetical protein K491DRAFT_692293 [Lophiostoma macrostomum CBS 122681]|uniref:Uncharacterized protein n=1 Tax=Lophiostoma macrostomum CBS 122681 TaxID=1314788 RepID=A0A6A6T7X6_9PLEO|nr:hypothetical protein K491DRAFT_692293 [Lophiostoma macrostomum CBS 122681]